MKEASLPTILEDLIEVNVTSPSTMLDGPFENFVTSPSTMLDGPIKNSVDDARRPKDSHMRHSELSLVLIRLKVHSEPHHVLIWHQKWRDWSFVGGHVESHERNDWARAAVRECNEELTPLKFGQDFTLLPLLDQPLRWGPVPSKSAHDEPTIYTAQIFALRFLRSPAECLARLPADEFCVVPESELINRAQNPNALTALAINKIIPTSLSWDSALPSLPLKSQTLSA